MNLDPEQTLGLRYVQLCAESMAIVKRSQIKYLPRLCQQGHTGFLAAWTATDSAHVRTWTTAVTVKGPRRHTGRDRSASSHSAPLGQRRHRRSEVPACRRRLLSKIMILGGPPLCFFSGQWFHVTIRFNHDF
jgi:hypothetical protein